MAPKRKPTEEEEEEFVVSEEEEVPKKKKGPTRKKKPAADGDEASPSKPKRAKTKAITEPVTLPDGWTLHPPSLIYKADPEAQGGSKIAAIDLDGTLVTVKSGAQFPKGPDDWRLFNKQVPAKLQELLAEGYQIAIISNQGGIKSALEGKMSQNLRGRVEGILAELRKKGPLPAQFICATQSDDYRKPETGMWDFMVKNLNKGVEPDKSQCLYIGDAAGRPGDIGNGDKEFAANVGIEFKTPEDFFGECDTKRSSGLEVGGADAGHNTKLARMFEQLAERARANNENMFKINAYTKVAKILAAWPEPITSSKQVAKEKGVGKGSLAKIDEFLATGKVASLEEAGVEAGAVPKQDTMALKFL